MMPRTPLTCAAPVQEGVDKMQRYRTKFGDARVAAMLPRMQAVGLEDGIRFDYGGRVGNTLDAHRLVELAWSKGGAALQDRVVEQLFHSYFECQGNLGDVDVLVAAAVAAGMDGAEVRAFLLSSDLVDSVQRDMREFVSRFRISGVPFVIVGKRPHTVSGAQEAWLLEGLMEDIIEEDLE
jgi:predicted DsbA family dithiol-disulfide isomerase